MEELIPLGSRIEPYGRLIAYGWMDGLYCALLNGSQIAKIPESVIKQALPEGARSPE